MKRFIPGLNHIAAAAVLAAVLPLTATAADVGKELATAADHAGYAADADSPAKVQLHLHHVINCLVGPDSEHFEAEAGNPCADQGNGALADMGAQDERRSQVERALTYAEKGAATASGIDGAKQAATRAQQILGRSGSE